MTKIGSFSSDLVALNSFIWGRIKARVEMEGRAKVVLISKHEDLLVIET